MRNKPGFGEFIFNLEIQFSAALVRFGRCHCPLLSQPVGIQLDAQVRQLGFGAFELPLCVKSRLLDLGIAQLHQNRVSSHTRDGQGQNPFDASGVDGWNPPDVFRNKGAIAAHLAEHFTTFHGVHEQRGLFDERDGGLKSRQPKRCSYQNDDRPAA